MIAPTIGSIFVEMKKNSTSRHLGTGRIDNAYAAGNARMSTITVEVIETSSECCTYSRMLELPDPFHSAENWVKVGLKKTCGVAVLASVSDLKPVMSIQNTGKKKTKTINPTVKPHTSVHLADYILRKVVDGRHYRQYEDCSTDNLARRIKAPYFDNFFIWEEPYNGGPPPS